MLTKKIGNLSLILALMVGLFSAARPTGTVNAASIVVYDAIPAALPPNMSSLGFQATQTSEFGDYIHLDGASRQLRTVTVTMSTWALQSTYPAMTDPAGWTHPITLKIYNAIPGTPNGLGSLIAAKGQSFLIPWRPEADPTCPDPTAWRASDGSCYFGYAFNITFDFSSLNVTLPDDIIVGVAYDTNTWGYHPIGLPGPYESLNVGAKGATTIGSDDNIDHVFWNTLYASYYADGGAAGVGIFREDIGWDPYGTLPIQITAEAPPTILYVNQAWSGISAGVDPDGAGPAQRMGYDAFVSIQPAVDAAAVGGTIHVATGTYVENVLVNKFVTILGSGSGAGQTVVTTPAAFDSKVGVFQIAASGLSAEMPLLLQDLRIQPVAQAGISVGRFTEATGVSVNYLALDNVFVVGTNTTATTEQERGLYVDLSSSLNHLAVTDSAFNNLAYGWYLQKLVSADTSTVSDVVVSNTLFNHNNLKGLYAEKLTEAVFMDCVFSQNGYSPLDVPSYFLPWMAGVDINLKAGAYQDLTFFHPTVTNNALGGAREGVGMTIKARSDGATYGAFPATLANVVITSGAFTGNERGIRIGEPGKNNPGPTNVHIHFNRFFGNEQTYTGTDGSIYGAILNQSSAPLDAENNWFGCNEGPNDAAGDCEATDGLVTADEWLVLTAVADPASLLPGATSAVEASLIMNSAAEDTSADGTVPDGILMAFSAPDGGSVLPASGATLVGSANTVFTAPAVDQVYRVCAEVDNETTCADLTVANIAPEAGADAYSVVEDHSLSVAAPGVLGNDTDDNGDALIAVLVTQPANGLLTLNADGSFTYTPKPDFAGLDTFTYRANDSLLDSNTVTVTLTVSAVNDGPQAVDDTYTLQENGRLEVAAPGVLANDVEVDGDGVSVSIVTATAHGVLSLASDGSFVYVPEAGFYGADTFEYQLTTYPLNKAPWTDTAIVTINVTPLFRMWLPVISR